MSVFSCMTSKHLKNLAAQHDDSLRAIQRQNDLNAFIRYERRLARAYAQSQNPYPPRWLRSSHGRRIQGHRLIDAPR